MAFKKMLHIWCGLLSRDLLPPTEPFEGYWGMMGSLLQQDLPPQSAARSFLGNLPKASFCTSYQRFNSKSKVWKGCEGLVIKPSSLFMMSFSFLWRKQGGESWRKIQVWDWSPHAAASALYWSLESCAYWQEHPPPRKTDKWCGAVPLNIYGCPSCLGPGPCSVIAFSVM